MVLADLKQAVTTLHGVGQAALRDLARIDIFQIKDLLLHLPRAYEDRTVVVPIRDIIAAKQGFLNTTVRVIDHQWFGAKRNLKIIVEDQTGQAELLCFNRDFLQYSLPIGKEVQIFGWTEVKFGACQLSAFVTAEISDADFRQIVPIYPLTGRLQQGFFRKTIGLALTQYLPLLADNLPQTLLEREGIVGLPHALRDLHHPSHMDRLPQARQRLVFEELYQLQVKMAQAVCERKGMVNFRVEFLAGRARPTPGDPILSDLSQDFLKRLPFRLTSGQLGALMEITSDFKRDYPMLRLLQGDVGCGKTLVAVVAALEMITRGFQVALLVPTVLLARQHADSIDRLLNPLGLKVALMAGPIEAKAKSPLQTAIESGEVNLIVGTHALFAASTRYQNLGLVIVDEQHRFGVQQRQTMIEKAALPNALLMSATPIPQTLALTVFGDMELSTIRDRPAGRLAIETHLARMGNEQKVYEWVRRELSKGYQAYFVYPLIDGEDQPDLKSVSSAADALAKNLGVPVGVLHSRLAEPEKSEVMRRFSSGELKIVVATSVVEVGVDVATANCMVIEHAERFGLSALHQLRGRVGRGSIQSFCFLVYAEPLTDLAKERLRALKEHHDGFLLAEKDLELRGLGDLDGVRQSGIPSLRFADIKRDEAVLRRCRELAYQEVIDQS